MLEFRLSGLYLYSETQGPAFGWEGGGGAGPGSLLVSERSGLRRLEAWMLAGVVCSTAGPEDVRARWGAGGQEVLSL